MRISGLSRHFPRGGAAVALAAFAAGAALDRPAHASDGCRVQIDGPESAAWRPAAFELGTELETKRLLSNCRLVSLVAAEGRARLTFTTHDGRSAERTMEDPIELLPTVQALSVALPAPEPSASKPSSPKAEAVARPPSKSKPAPDSPTMRPSESAYASSSTDAPNPYALSPFFGAQVGFRGGANRLISPTLGLSVAVPISSWELGLLGRYEAHYVATNGQNEGRPETSGVVLGVNFGLRTSLGKLLLRGGGSLLLAALREDGGAKNGRAEARIGAYIGAVFPSQSKLRFRLDLGPELVPYNIGQSEQNAAGEWSLPWWAMTVAVGAEFG